MFQIYTTVIKYAGRIICLLSFAKPVLHDNGIIRIYCKFTLFVIIKQYKNKAVLWWKKKHEFRVPTSCLSFKHLIWINHSTNIIQCLWNLMVGFVSLTLTAVCAVSPTVSLCSSTFSGQWRHVCPSSSCLPLLSKGWDLFKALYPGHS